MLLLHDVFDYRFAEVAAAVDRSEAAVRQIASRARRRIASQRRARPRPTDARVEAVRPGLLFTDGDEPHTVLSVELDDDGLVDRIFAQLNPEKLAHLGRQGRP